MQTRLNLFLPMSLRYSLAVIMIVELLRIFVPFGELQVLQSGAAGVALLAALVMNRGVTLLLPTFLILAGVWITVQTGTSPGVYWLGLREMTDILTLVVLVNLVGLLFKRKLYVEALLRVSRPLVRTPGHLNAMIMLLSHFISSVMSVAGMTVAYQLFERLAKDNRPFKSQLALTTLRGFSLTALWSPNQTAFAVTLYFTQAPLVPTMAAGSILALLGLTLAVFLRPSHSRGEVETPFTLQSATREKNQVQIEKDRSLFAEFMFTIVGLIAVIVLVEHLTTLKLVNIIPLITLLAIILVYSVERQVPTLFRELRSFYSTLEYRKKEAALILASGFLITALRESGSSNLGVEWFQAAINSAGVNAVLAVPFLIIFLGQLGLPPIPATMLVAGSLQPAQLGAVPELLSLALLLGVVVSTLISPVSVPLLVQSTNSGYSTTQLGVRWNWQYAVLLFVVGQLVLQGLAWLWPVFFG